MRKPPYHLQQALLGLIIAAIAGIAIAIKNLFFD